MHLIDGNQTTGEVEGVKLIFGSRKRRSKHTTSSSTTFLKSWFFEGDYALRHESKYGLLHTISGGVLERKEKKKLAKILICINWEAFFWVPSVSATQFFTPTLEWYMNKSWPIRRNRKCNNKYFWISNQNSDISIYGFMKLFEKISIFSHCDKIQIKCIEFLDQKLFFATVCIKNKKLKLDYLVISEPHRSGLIIDRR